jgi:general stress protein 26
LAEDLKIDALNFLKKNRNSLFGTVDKDTPVMRVMWIAYIDDNFTLWYVTKKSSGKIRHIEQNSNVCISVNTESEGLRIFGNAKCVSDERIKSEKWQEDWSTFFTGKDDPDYALINVKPSKVEYSHYEKFGLDCKDVL